MANKNLFQTLRGALIPQATVRNDAGGAAYELSPYAALARMAVTGCFGRTFYATPELQLERVLEAARQDAAVETASQKTDGDSLHGYFLIPLDTCSGSIKYRQEDSKSRL